MKKKIFLFVLSVVCLAALFGAFLTVNATEAPVTAISGHNLSLDDSVQIIYYVYQVAPEGAEVGVLCWFDPQENYTIENAQYKLKQTGTRTISGTEYAQYNFPYIAAKMYTQDVYAVSYVKVGEEVTYGNLDKYSVLQYCYNKKGSTSIISGSTATLGELVTDLLNYGATAQKYFNYKNDRLANADYYQISVENGVLEDGTTEGLYQVGKSVSLKATLPTGATFFHWKNSVGAVVGTTAELTVSAPAKAETYTAVFHTLSTWIDEIPATESTEGTKGHYHCTECGKYFDESYNEIDDLAIPVLPPEVNYSKGLEYISNGDGTCYVTSIGDCTDTEIVIPPISPEGDQVTEIGTSAFSGCSSLTKVSISEGITSIKNKAFFNCSSLSVVEIPDSIVSVVNTAFSNCSSLQYNTYGNAIYLGNKNNPYVVMIKVTDSSVRSCTIPSGTRIIPGNIFYQFKYINYISIPSSTVSIGRQNFTYYLYQVYGKGSVNYGGTKAQWNALCVASDWSYYTIHCTDGDIN